MSSLHLLSSRSISWLLWLPGLCLASGDLSYSPQSPQTMKQGFNSRATSPTHQENCILTHIDIHVRAHAHIHTHHYLGLPLFIFLLDLVLIFWNTVFFGSLGWPQVCDLLPQLPELWLQIRGSHCAQLSLGLLVVSHVVYHKDEYTSLLKGYVHTLTWETAQLLHSLTYWSWKGLHETKPG